MRMSVSDIRGNVSVSVFADIVFADPPWAMRLSPDNVEILLWNVAAALVADLAEDPPQEILEAFERIGCLPRPVLHDLRPQLYLEVALDPTPARIAVARARAISSLEALGLTNADAVPITDRILTEMIPAITGSPASE